MLTFKDLKKRVTVGTAGQHRLFERLRNKPFWIWNIEDHKIEDSRRKGLPTKERIQKPIFDYERILYDTLLILGNSNLLNHDFKHKHLWVKKATGLGITEFFLRLMATKLIVTKIVLCPAPLVCPLPSDFKMTVAGNNANPATFPGSPLGTTVTLSAGPYSVDETAPTSLLTLTKTVGADCSGTINAGETKNCKITNSYSLNIPG